MNTKPGMTYRQLTIDPQHFVFPVQLHLKAYIDAWLSQFAQGNQRMDEAYHFIRHTIDTHPFLAEPIAEIGLLEAFREFLDVLFAQMLPHQGLMNTIQAVTAPFYYKYPIYATGGYDRLVGQSNGDFRVGDIPEEKEPVDYRTLYAYKLILRKYYDLDMKVDQPIICALRDAQTRLRRYYKLTGPMHFIDVINLAPLPQLDSQMLQHMLDQRFDAATWAQILPPKNFLFSGVSMITLVDITIEESTTRLQQMLMDRRYDNPGWFSAIVQEMRNLFRVPDLRTGIATLQNNGEFNFNSSHPLWNSLLVRELGGDASWLPASGYLEVLQSAQTVIIEDLRKHEAGHHRFGQAALKAGVHNLLITPLTYGDQVIGILELATPDPGEIQGLALFKIMQIKGIFANALKHHLDEFENRVEAVMLEAFTSIHPAIRWRFRDAAIRLLDQSTRNTEEDIFFEDIYPFYGSLDVRNSSKNRNAAIARDLMFNLHCAYQVLDEGRRLLRFDILDELMDEVGRRMEKARTIFSSDDELSLAQFIRQEITPVITHLAHHHEKLRAVSGTYMAFAQSDTGICTLNRSAYEEALRLINQCIVRLLDQEEKDLQQLYPCYFEKFRTDGVEYSIYTGPSISPKRPFDPLYVDNLRLRQLVWTCRIVQSIRRLQPSIQSLFNTALHDTPCAVGVNDGGETTLEIAPLIFAYGNTITLKFRPDEKRLDVEGAYNVRYEMMKKRLDKATVEGTQERLTQPGHLAIVFTSETEVSGYARHLAYMASKGLIEPDWHALTLEPLQGVTGLRAIRARVKDESDV